MLLVIYKFVQVEFFAINCEMRSLQLIKINTLFSKSKAFQSLLMQIWCSMMLLMRLSSPSLLKLYMRSSITIQINIHTSLASNFIIFFARTGRGENSLEETLLTMETEH
jgi:hypothetical protein